MKTAIIYYSFGGNTKKLPILLKKKQTATYLKLKQKSRTPAVIIALLTRDKKKLITVIAQKSNR